MNALRWVRRLCFLSAAALGVVALVAAPLVQAAEGDTADRPVVFQGGASTAAVSLDINMNPAATIPQLVHAEIPHGYSEFGSGNQSYARAASLYPGVGVGKGANLVWGEVLCANGFPCDQFPADFPPAWPLTAEASYPTQIDATPTVPGTEAGKPSDPFSMQLHQVKAHAGRDFVSTTAVIDDLRVLPTGGAPSSNSSSTGLLGTSTSASGGLAGDPALLHVGHLESTTKQHFEGQTLIVTADSVLDNVSLAGGAIHIDEIHATSTSSSDGDHVKPQPHLSITGVTVGGQSAEITEDGLLVNGTPADQGAPLLVASSASNFFKSLGQDVKLLSSSKDAKDGSADGQASGILVHFNLATFPVGWTGDLILGSASTTSYIPAPVSSDFGSFDTGGPTDLVSVSPGFATTNTGGGQSFATGTSGSFVQGSSLAPTNPAPGATPGRAPVTDNQTTQAGLGPIELLKGAAAQRVKLLYGAWTLALLGLALGSRLPWLRVARQH